MTDKRNKYDTDPLDPDFAARTESLRGGPTGEAAPAAAPVPNPHAEEPTRRFYEPPPQAAPQPEGEQFPTSYPSVFIPPVYQPPAQQQRGYTSFGAGVAPHAPQAAYQEPFSAQAKPTQRPVAKLGIPENVALVLPYAPFYIGLVAAIVELLVAPRTETRVRFHAAQGLALQLVMVVGAIAFDIIEGITDNGIGGLIFWLASTVFLIFSMFRVWEGKPHHIAPLDELTQKINSKFEPRK